MSTGFNGSLSVSVPTSDTTQQTALLKIPGSTSGTPTLYDDTNTIALFPAPIQRLGVTAVAGSPQTNPSQQQQTGTPVLSIVPWVNQVASLVGSSSNTLTIVIKGAFLASGPSPSNLATALGRDLPGSLAPGMQGNDIVTVWNTTNFNATYKVIGIPSATSIIVAPLSGTIPVLTEIPVRGVLQFETVQVTTSNTSYSAAVGSKQTITGTPIYDGTFIVRIGHNPLYLVVPGASTFPPGGEGPVGGSIYPAPSSAILTPATAGATTQSLPTFIKINNPPNGLRPYTLPIQAISRPAGQGITVLWGGNFLTPLNSLQPGDHVRVVPNATNPFKNPFFAGVYTIAPSNFNPSNPITNGLIFNETPGQIAVGEFETFTVNPFPNVVFELVAVTVPINQLSNFTGAPPGSQQEISGAQYILNDGGYNGGPYTVRQPVSVTPPQPQIFWVQIPGAYNFPDSGGGYFGQLNIVIQPPPPPPTPTGPPVSGVETATVNGGIVNLLSPVPQMLQFTNRMILALGNGFPPYYAPDGSGTPTNPGFQSTAGISGTPPSGSISLLNSGPEWTLVSITVDSSNGHGLQPGSLMTLTPPGSTTSYVGYVTSITQGSKISGTGGILPPPAPQPPNPTIPDPNNPAVYNPSTTFQVHLFAGFFPYFSTPVPTSGTIQETASPLPNNYQVAFPFWAPGIYIGKGDIYVPLHQPTQTGGGVYLQCTQAGSTGGVEPTWPNPDLRILQTNQPGIFPIKNIIDYVPSGALAIGATAGPTVVPPPGGAIWEEVGYLNSLHLPLPGAAHIAVYSSCLFAFNTYIHNTTGTSATPTGGPTIGIDGPTSIRQSDVNNPFSWNPANQAFLDKDDGSEGMGLGTFTIAAVGIPPQGALFAFKNYTTYEIAGLFGAGINISRVKTERGCTAPRTIKFIPTYGVGRMTHLGISIVDGVNDTLLSDPIRPYLFLVNDSIVGDINFIDPAWMPLCYADLTANPAMYVMLAPVGNDGNSFGMLTRGFAWDITSKGWSIIDYPFSLSTISQATLAYLPPPTILTGFQDGLIQRWQYGDVDWLMASPEQTVVSWSYRTPVTASKNPDQRVFVQEVSIKGVNSHQLGPIFVAPNLDGVYYPPRQAALMQFRTGGKDFLSVASIMLTGQRFYADISGTGGVEIDGDNFHIVPKPLAGRLVIA